MHGLPTRDSVYDSITDIYKAYVAALVPAYGISVMVLHSTQKKVHIRCNRYHTHFSHLPGGICQWVALCRRRRDGKWIVDIDASTFEHSHGPRQEILADPEWRPRVINPDAREALGMEPLPHVIRYKKQASDEPVSGRRCFLLRVWRKGLTPRCACFLRRPAPAQEGTPVCNDEQRKSHAAAARADSRPDFDCPSCAAAGSGRDAPLDSVGSAFVPFAGFS